MNRPKRKDYVVVEWQGYPSYISDLEKYCNELEKKYKLAIEAVAWSKCPGPEPTCKNFQKCTECWDYFFQMEAERVKDE